MLDLSQRADVEEQMDGPCRYEDLRDCLRDLSVVNRLTMAHRPTMEWVERVVPGLGGRVRIVDVGCGYGDMLRRIERWAGRRGLEVELIGVDLNGDAVRAAREATPAGSRIRWVAGDVTTCAAVAEADLVVSTAVMHHLCEDEIVRMLAWMDRTAQRGWLVSDLHRQAVPYYVFGAVMRGGWWHRFIRPDGLASIRRSFVPEDWRRICVAAGLDLGAVRIAEYRPARLCVGRVKQGPPSPP